MTDMSAAAKNYYQQFLAGLPEDSPYRQHRVMAEGWGDSPQMADELGSLIAAGTKTATCSAVVEWESAGNALPEPGLLTVVLDGKDEPLCIIETTQVEVKHFDQVDAQFAYEEGEGDRSLAYWRAAHRRFFERYLSMMGLAFSEDLLLVCESFRLIYK